MIRRLLLTLALLVLPTAVAAKTLTTWDFTNGQMPGQWRVFGLQTTHIREGLRLQAQEQGSILRDAPLLQNTRTIRLHFAYVSAPTQAFFLWHESGNPTQGLYQLPITLNPGTDVTVSLDMTIFPTWDPHSDLMGLGLPAGSDVVLSQMELIEWSLPERLMETGKALWTFDTMQAHTINFLWGPLYVQDSDSRAKMFTSNPPIGKSVTRILYLLLGIMAGLCILHWIMRRHFGLSVRSRAVLGLSPELGAFVLLFAALWLLFDLRMGAETISYAVTDAETFVFAPPGERTFRDYLNFHDALFQSLPVLTAEPRYGLLVPSGNPLPSRSFYHTYPSKPLRDGDDLSGVRNWFVFLRDDVTVGSGGMLLVGGKPVAGPGQILQRFDDASFLFRTQQ